MENEETLRQALDYCIEFFENEQAVERIIEYINDAVKFKESELKLSGVGNCAYLVQNKKTLINHGLFSSEEKAEIYINGNSKFAIQKCSIA